MSTRATAATEVGIIPARLVEVGLPLAFGNVIFFDGVSPIHTKRNYPSPEIERFGRTIDRADGFVIVTPEYNHGYPAVLKKAMDHTFPEWNRKALAFAGWGNVGGARAIEALRLVAVEFEMAPLSRAWMLDPDTV